MSRAPATAKALQNVSVGPRASNFLAKGLVPLSHGVQDPSCATLDLYPQLVLMVLTFSGSFCSLFYLANTERPLSR